MWYVRYFMIRVIHIDYNFGAPCMHMYILVCSIVGQFASSWLFSVYHQTVFPALPPSHFYICFRSFQTNFDPSAARCLYRCVCVSRFLVCWGHDTAVVPLFSCSNKIQRAHRCLRLKTDENNNTKMTNGLGNDVFIRLRGGYGRKLERLLFFLPDCIFSAS